MKPKRVILPEITIADETVVKYMLGDCLNFFNLPHPDECPCDSCERTAEHAKEGHRFNVYGCRECKP